MCRVSLSLILSHSLDSFTSMHAKLGIPESARSCLPASQQSPTTLAHTTLLGPAAPGPACDENDRARQPRQAGAQAASSSNSPRAGRAMAQAPPCCRQPRDGVGSIGSQRNLERTCSAATPGSGRPSATAASAAMQQGISGVSGYTFTTATPEHGMSPGRTSGMPTATSRSSSLRQQPRASGLYREPETSLPPSGSQWAVAKKPNVCGNPHAHLPPGRPNQWHPRRCPPCIK